MVSLKQLDRGRLYHRRVDLEMMSDNGKTEKSVSHEQLLVVAGLLAGFSFTAMMLMLQSSETFRAMIWPEYSDAYFVLLVTIARARVAICL